MKIEDIAGLRLDPNGLLDIPTHINRIKFDVGLSWCAPNSALWLQNDVNKDLFVIGVEANKYACERLGTMALNPHPPHEKHKLTKDNYMLLNCALDNNCAPDDGSDISMKPFYHVDVDPGTSSFLKPTSMLQTHCKLQVKEFTEVPTITLGSLLKRIPWGRFQFIEHIKTDCQGVDLNVIEGAGAYLSERVVYLDCELEEHGLYEGEIDVNLIVQAVQRRGFRILTRGPNSSFVNTSLEHLIPIYGLNNRTVDT